jgi:predicted ATP-grasp superfamily ATP-dependent carboligase
MASSEHLLIFGASARAAAFSALRAAMRPWCADLFGDADVQKHCATFLLDRGEYPEGLLRAIRQAPPGPWIYTGGLENRPTLLAKLAQLRPLWGNHGDALALARSPTHVFKVLQQAGIPCPALRSAAAPPPADGRWLSKSLRGSGGTGVHVFEVNKAARPAQASRGPSGPGYSYLQEYQEGDSSAALYVGDGQRARFLGLTRQLVGESWLHAAPFHYCGSIGPIEPSVRLRPRLNRLGDVLAGACGLRGLFGVDGILSGEVLWPVEVNPRYTASIEVLECALGVSLLNHHRAVFDSAYSAPSSIPGSEGQVIGKAILYARESLRFPRVGPWLTALQCGGPVRETPDFADIPHAGEPIERGRPVLSFFARGATVADCADALRAAASDLDRWLYGQ